MDFVKIELGGLVYKDLFGVLFFSLKFVVWVKFFVFVSIKLIDDGNDFFRVVYNWYQVQVIRIDVVVLFKYDLFDLFFYVFLEFSFY